MKRRIVWIALVVLAAGSLTGAYLYAQNGAAGPRLRTAKVTRGPLTAAVATSGNLNAVVTVQVGSQVSGQIKELYADFNTVVERNQLIARIDPASFEARVTQARAEVEAADAAVLNQRAQLERARADIDNARAALAAARAQTAKSEVALIDARRDLDRKSDLFTKELVARSERDTAQATHDSADAQVEANRAQEVALSSAIRSAEAQLRVVGAQLQSAEATVRQKRAALDQALVDLDRTFIRAPVDGVVVSRNVDVGQTVAASLQAPILFVIAQDLTKMQVDTNVDEADIGRIQEGQAATFTVDSFPGQTFAGQVVQIRKSPKTIQNVVTYNVVVAAENAERKLMPGMTASLKIVVETRPEVLRVPNAALRFRPPGEESPDFTPPGQFAPSPQPGAESMAGVDEIRERLVRELKLTADQQQRIEPILDQARERFRGLERKPGSQRRAAALEIREETRQKIRAMLTPEQQGRYDQLPQGQAARVGSRARPGRVFTAGADGKLMPVGVRLGITDGSFTELLDGSLADGQEVVTGMVSVPASPAGRPAPAPATAPRMRF
jgi:HlyD family secretion protein